MKKRCGYFDAYDEGSPVSGRGWAIVKRGILEGRIYFHLGNDSGFKAERIK